MGAIVRHWVGISFAIGNPTPHHVHTRHSSTTVHNHREQSLHGRGGRIPVRVTTLRCPGLRSGGPPPEPAVEVER